MKSTISNIILPANTWVNIYLAPAIVAAGIVVGDRLSFVKIKGSVDLNFGATKPVQDIASLLTWYEGELDLPL